MSLPHMMFTGRNYGSAGSSAPYWDSSVFSNWTGDHIDFDPNNGDADWNGTASTTPQALGAAFDHSNNRIVGGYSTACYYSNVATGNSGVYTGSADFYQSSTLTDFSGHSASGLGSSGRGTCIAHLANGTPVVCIGHTNLQTIGSISTYAMVYVFNLSSGAFLGTFAFESSLMTGNSTNMNDLAGLSWDGLYLCATSRAVYAAGNGSAMCRLEIPSATLNTSTTVIVTPYQECTIPDAVHYGMSFGGYDTNGDSHFYISNINSAPNGLISHLKVVWGSAAGVNGHSVSYPNGASQFAHQTQTATYTLYIDFKNRRMVMGGYSNNKIRSFGE